MHIPNPSPSRILPLVALALITACSGGGDGIGPSAPAGPSDLDYGSASATLTRSFEVTALTPTLTGGADTFTITTGTLPTGLAIDSSSGVISGTPLAIQAPALVTITAELTGTGSDTFNITFDVTAPSTSVLYTASRIGGIIGIHTVDPTTGALSIRGDVAGLDSPTALALTPDLQNLYALNADTGALNAYSIAAGTGDLTELAGSPFPITGGAGLNASDLTISPDGSTLYTANRTTGNISLFTIAANGTLTERAGSPFGAFPGARSLSTSSLPSGDFIYVAASTAGTTPISTLQIAANGDLTLVDSDDAGNKPTIVASTLLGDFLYVGNENDGTVSAFAIASDGSLTELGSSPVAVAASAGFLADMATADDGTLRSLYVSSINGVISQYAIAVDGSLSLLAPDSITSPGGSARGLAMSPDGLSLYACDMSSSELLSFTAGTGGVLEPKLVMPRLSSSAAMFSAVVLPSKDPAAWTTSTLYAASSASNSLNVFDVSADGLIHAANPFDSVVAVTPQSLAIAHHGNTLFTAHPGNSSSPLVSTPLLPSGELDVINATGQSGNNAKFIALDNNSEFLYAVDDTGKTIRPYPIAANGTIGSPAASLGVGNLAFGITLSPSGRFAYVPNFSDGNVSQFNVNVETGALTPTSPASANSFLRPTSVAVHPSGLHAYVACAGVAGLGGDIVVMYHSDPATGALTPMATGLFAAGVDPNAIEITPDGRYAIISNAGDSTITTHAINNLASDSIEDGLLGPTISTAATVTQPRSLAISADGLSIYVGINVGTGINAFAIDTNGILTPLDAEATTNGILDIALRETRE